MFLQKRVFKTVLLREATTYYSVWSGLIMIFFFFLLCLLVLHWGDNYWGGWTTWGKSSCETACDLYMHVINIQSWTSDLLCSEESFLIASRQLSVNSSFLNPLFPLQDPVVYWPRGLLACAGYLFYLFSGLQLGLDLDVCNCHLPLFGFHQKELWMCPSGKDYACFCSALCHLPSS